MSTKDQEANESLKKRNIPTKILNLKYYDADDYDIKFCKSSNVSNQLIVNKTTKKPIQKKYFHNNTEIKMQYNDGYEYNNDDVLEMLKLKKNSIISNNNDKYNEKNLNFNINRANEIVAKENLNDSNINVDIDDYDDSNIFDNNTNKIEATQYLNSIELSDEQFKFLELIQTTNKNIFLSGSAGTGKTFLIKQCIKILKYKFSEDQIAVCATTGVAAIDIGGMTLHNFAGIGIGGNNFTKMSNFVIERWYDTKVLIVDEVSMLQVDYFNQINNVAINCKKNKNLFGGIRLIFVGDFLQLPPISKYEDNKQLLFESQLWKNLNFESLVLKKSFRQQEDEEFFNTLQNIRIGKLENKDLQLLQSCINRNIPPNIQITKLFAYNATVDFENIKFLNKIKTHELVKKSAIFIVTTTKYKHILQEMLIINTKIKDYYVKELLFKNQDQNYEDYCKIYFKNRNIIINIAEITIKNTKFYIPYHLQFKQDAQVMLCVNLDVKKGLVNGSQGTIIGFTKDNQYPIVKFNNTTINIHPHPWLAGSYKVNNEKYSIYYIQYPLKLCWSTTIHKSQGLTMENISIDFSGNLQDSQAYVALSRVKKSSGLYLKNFKPQCIHVNPKIVEFYNNLESDNIYNKFIKDL